MYDAIFLASHWMKPSPTNVTKQEFIDQFWQDIITVTMIVVCIFGLFWLGHGPMIVQNYVAQKETKPVFKLQL